MPGKRRPSETQNHARESGEGGEKPQHDHRPTYAQRGRIFSVQA